jgi:5-methylcytosine-specific restriction endonuclease McrA
MASTPPQRRAARPDRGAADAADTAAADAAAAAASHPRQSADELARASAEAKPDASRQVKVTLRPCIVCGRPTTGSRRAAHALPYRGWDQTHARRQVLSEENVCWRCGRPATPTDPLVAGHLIPRAIGGPTTRENMRAEHRSCNAADGVGPPREQKTRRHTAPGFRERETREVSLSVSTAATGSLPGVSGDGCADRGSGDRQAFAGAAGAVSD